MHWNRYAFLLLAGFALLVRAGAVWIQPASFDADPDQYAALAQNMNEYGVFGYGTRPTAFRPPLYPAVLSPILRLSGSSGEATDSPRDQTSSHLISDHERSVRRGAIAFLHVILGVLTVLLTVALGREMGLHWAGALLAGLLVAVDPILLSQSRVVMTETLAVFFVALSAWTLLKSESCRTVLSLGVTSLLPGILLGLAALCRPAFLAWGALLFLSLFLYRKGSRLVVSSLLFGLGMVLVLLPWTIRNSIELGKPVLTTTHDGYTLLLANNDLLYDWYERHDPWDRMWDASEFHAWWSRTITEYERDSGLRPETIAAELAENDLARRQAWTTIRNRPGMFLKTSLIRVGNLWQCLPYQTTDTESRSAFLARSAVGVFYLLELSCVVLGLVQVLRTSRNARRASTSWSWLWLLALLLSVQIPHLLFWTNMRMRAVLVVGLALLSGALFGLKSPPAVPNQEDRPNTP